MQPVSRDNPFQCVSVGRIFPFTSLHTTGSLCVPVDKDTRGVSKKYVEGKSTVKTATPPWSGFICFIKSSTTGLKGFKGLSFQSNYSFFLTHIKTFCFSDRQKMGGIITWASSSSVKSFLMLNVFLISSGVLPLIMLATVLQVTSNRPLMSK